MQSQRHSGRRRTVFDRKFKDEPLVSYRYIARLPRAKNSRNMKLLRRRQLSSALSSVAEGPVGYDAVRGGVLVLGVLSRVAMANRTRLVYCLLVLPWLACLPSLNADDLARAADYEGKPIQSIRYEPAKQPLTSEELNRVLALRAGAPLQLSDVRGAIRRLYATGVYQDVEFGWEPAPGGVVVVIRTTEQWFVGPVEVRGKVKLPPSEGQLSSAARLELGTPLNDDDLD